MSNYSKTPVIFQLEATECGAASLAMIFAYWGKNLPLEKMRIETGVSRDGCNAGNIMRAAKKYGFECHGYRKEPEDLRTIDTPCIIHWNFNHFVVFEGFKGKNAYINDPALGRRKISFEELDDSFTGIVLTFKPTKSFKKEKKGNTLTKFILNRISGQYGIILKLLFIGLLLVFPGLIFPILTQFFLDEILIKNNTDLFTSLLIAMLATVGLQTILTFYRDRILNKFQKKMVLLSSRNFLYRMFRLSLSFYDQRYAGDLAERISNNANVSNFLAGELAGTVLNFFIAIFYLILLIIYSPSLTVIVIITAVFNVIIVKVTSDIITNGSIKLQQDWGKLSGSLCAGLSITNTLKAAGTENEYVSRILGYSAKTINEEQKLSKSQQIINALPGALKMIADVLVLVIGGSFVIRGEITIGMLVAFSSLYGAFSDPIEKIVGFVKSIQTTKADMGRVEDIMKYELDPKFDKSNPKIDLKTKLNGSVEMRNISFGYSKLKQPIISDFNFKIGCGSSIAFVGPSGCGKSTISKILSGLYEPWKGCVFFDGIPANEIPNEVLSASISTVSQNITLFSGTIRDNLTMWNDNISEADMIAAAKDACIHDVISQKPGAYDFHLSEGASNLSGGQKQRLEIARALTTNPTILILDEATSALDPVVEKEILDNIKRRGCTCIVVAHRLSAIRDCSQIIVMSSGRIVQNGSHDELSKCDGYYLRFIQNI